MFTDDLNPTNKNKISAPQHPWSAAAHQNRLAPANATKMSSHQRHRSLEAFLRSSSQHRSHSHSPWKYENNNSPLAIPPNASPVAAPYIPIPDRGHGHTTRVRMDPFEVRIRFTGLLQHLNASLTSANKAAQYALKYRDMDEDLHSCILEQLERVCLNIPLHAESVLLER